eukprot:tig00000246_g21501.t1
MPGEPRAVVQDEAHAGGQCRPGLAELGAPRRRSRWAPPVPGGAKAFDEERATRLSLGPFAGGGSSLAVASSRRARAGSVRTPSLLPARLGVWVSLHASWERGGGHATEAHCAARPLLAPPSSCPALGVHASGS